MKDLKGKVAVVTGAAMGMGRNLSERLIREGCAVALVDINVEALLKTKEELSTLGRCEAYCCDISDRTAVYALADRIERDLGPVAVLINNAGIVKARPLLDLDDEAIEKMININLTAQFWTCKAFLPGMIKRNEGHVVNIASAGGILAIPNLSAYCASKFGVIGFTDAVRQEMARLNVKIGFTYVCPNTVGTGMFAGSKMVVGTRILGIDEVTGPVIRAIRKNQAMVAVPSMPVKFLTPLTKLLLPVKAMDWLNRMLGMAEANDTWTGRDKNKNIGDAKKDERHGSSPAHKNRSFSKVFKKVLIVIGIVVMLNLALMAVNILQNGVGGWKGQIVEAIIGVQPDKATLADIEKLNKADLMQLFLAAEPPPFESMNGEYRAKIIAVGVLAPVTDYYTNHLFGPGRWLGKAFFPFAKDRAWGYNIFSADGKKISRTRKMNTYIGVSNIDRRMSFHLDYAPHNSGLVGTMHDEIRSINDKLFIGMGYMSAGGGSLNPAPFVLIGPPTVWVGTE